MAVIKNVEVLPVRFKSTNWDQSTAVIKITDENGMYGIGECDGPTEVIEALFNMETAHMWSMNPRDVLIGRDPVETLAIWHDLYEGLLWQGRRGLAMFAISGIDIALHDLAAKQHGIPVYKRLGGATREFATPYMTLYPESSGKGSLKQLLTEYEALFEQARQMKLKALKLAILPGEVVTDRALVQFIKDARHALGDETDLMIDFLYRWRDAYDAIHVLKALEKENLYFAEALLAHDDLIGHKKIVDKTGTRICGAEMATGLYEVKEWIENSGVAIVQPDINRCGGLTEIRRIAEYCDIYGVQVMPHGWKTGITASAGIHYHLSTRNAKYFEYLHPSLYDSPMRQELVTPEPILVNGQFEKSTVPGLGIDLNKAFLERLRK